MLSYRADGPFVVLATSGTATTDAERKSVFDAIRSDPSVRDGAYLIVDLRKYQARLTQSEIQNRVRELLDNLGAKIGGVCAVIVRDTSLRVGVSFQMVATNMNFRVGVFKDLESARKWLIAYAADLQRE